MDAETRKLLESTLQAATGIGGDVPRLESTRVRCVLSAVIFVVLVEALHQVGIEVSQETVYEVIGLFMSLAGLDTVRPVGKRTKPALAVVDPTPAPEADAA